MLAGNDLMALGCYDALAERGLRCPEDVSVDRLQRHALRRQVRAAADDACASPITRWALRAAELLLALLADEPDVPEPDRAARRARGASLDRARAGLMRSTERILTTHTGSLPRPASLDELLRAIDDGELSDDTAGFRAQVRDAVDGVVARQVAAGISVVNDGEMSKIGYSTYVKERLDGFGGEDVGFEFPHPDLVDFPEYMVPVMSRLTFRMPACIGEVTYRGIADAQTDIDNLRAAAGRGRRDRRVHDRGLSGCHRGVPRQPPLRQPRGVPLRAG